MILQATQAVHSLNINQSTLASLATITASVIIVLIQSVSAYLTHRSNLSHQKQMRQLDLEYKNKHDAYLKFITAVAHHKGNQTYAEKNAVLSALHSAILVCDNETLVLLKDFESLYTNKCVITDDLLMKISVSFNRELTKISSST